MDFDNQKKIGIMGGTFDPIHTGHLILAEQAREQFGLDEIWFMPSSKPPHKDRSHVTDAFDRENMVRLAIAGNPYFVYSDLELHRTGITYTSDTLLELDEKYPHTTFYFIMGADSLFSIDTWHEPQTIFDHVKVLASNRNAHADEELQKQILYLKERYRGSIDLIRMESVGISSTEIKEMRYNGGGARYYVPEKVYQYMEEHHLYRQE